MKHAFAILALATLGITAPMPALAQDFASGYDLVVRQHPTSTAPVVIVEVWSWTELDCSGGMAVPAAGVFEFILSDDILVQGPGQVDIDCKLEFPYWPACEEGFEPRAAGRRVLPFAFAHVLDGDISPFTIVFENPLHLMDVYMPVDDLTPRNVTIGTALTDHASACIVDGHSTYYETPIIVDGQIIIRVNGGCPADFDGDGELTIFDFLAYQNAFATGDLAADLDGDGVLTLFDFLAFQNEFDAGCE